MAEISEGATYALRMNKLVHDEVERLGTVRHDIGQRLWAIAEEAMTARDAEWREAIVPGNATSLLGEACSTPEFAAAFLRAKEDLWREENRELSYEAVQAYVDASPEMQTQVRALCENLRDDETDCDDREMTMSTLLEILSPTPTEASE